MRQDIHQQLLDVLSRIDRPGTYCTSGLMPPVFPGLEVTGAGTVALPLDERQAAALRKLARQAPYGKGTQTLVDTDVRRVWEIDADQVTLANPEWQEALQIVVSAVQAGLGLEQQQLEAHLYKLLLYEPGSFFLAHRDGEKLDGMVATLVIALPAPHEGGELVVRHEGQTETVDFSKDSRFQIQYAAFYADCEHEIRPVTSGYRLTLVYNLTLEKLKRTITAPTSREHIDAVASLLRQWSDRKPKTSAASTGATASKLAVLLDHQYTEAGLTCDALKGVDRARAEILFAAARAAGCDASLALVTYWESGSAQPSGDYGYGSRRHRGYGRYDDDYGDDDDDGGEHIMDEVFDSSLTAAHFSDADGNSLAFGRIPLDESELVSKQPLTEGKPDQEDFEGFTGNAGMTLERWYHRAAVMIWPEASRFDILCKAGVDAAVGGLEQMIRRWQQAPPNEQDGVRQPCLDFASRIIAHWPERVLASGHVARYGYTDVGATDSDEEEIDDDDLEGEDDDDFGEEPAHPQATSTSSFFTANRRSLPSDEAAKTALRPLISLLDELGEVSLISAWLRNVLARDATVDPGQTLGDLCQRYGWTTFQKELRTLFEHTSNETLERQARLLADWSLRQDDNIDRRKLCSELAQQLMSVVEHWNPRPAQRDWQARNVDLPALLPPLIQAFLALDEPALLGRLAKYVLDRPKEFDLTTVQVPALLSLETWVNQTVKRSSAPLMDWLAAVLAELNSRKSHPPKEPADWRRESKTGCACADCLELSRFLKDPNTKTLRLPLAERRRQHLHQIIDGKRLDATHVTERKGRPYTLVCTKTQASYERALKAYRLDLDHLAKISQLSTWCEELPAESPRPQSKAPRPKKRK